MTSRKTSTPGLEVVKRRWGYFIRHIASGLPAHSGLILRQRDAVAAADAVDRLGVDYTLPLREVNAAAECCVEGGGDAVARFLRSHVDHHPLPQPDPLPPPVRRAVPVPGALTLHIAT